MEVPSETEILDYILTFSQKPFDPILTENQYTAKRLMDESGYGKKWCQDRLWKMHKAGLCTREMVYVRSGWVAVYTFPEVPKFSSPSNVDKVE